MDGIYKWADERLGLTDVVAMATHKQVPQHKHSFWYYWGGISLLCFIIQLLTGVLLLVTTGPARKLTNPFARSPMTWISAG